MVKNGVIAESFLSVVHSYLLYLSKIFPASVDCCCNSFTLCLPICSVNSCKIW